jgi:hypothetical protein
MAFNLPGGGSYGANIAKRKQYSEGGNKGGDGKRGNNKGWFERNWWWWIPLVLFIAYAVCQ